jgi:putative FmdB family regulatory protein
MPIYLLRCKTCGKEFEELSKVQDRGDVRCPECGSQTEVRMAPANSGWKLKPYWNTNLDTKPIFIESKEQLRRECRKRGFDSPCLY